MIVEEHGKVLCMGYASFRERCEDTFRPWCERLRDQLADEAAQHRLRDVQHLLCELVETLDAGRVRYTETLERA
jgi:putative component of toxin-antitoxin plasmid stabilization module